MSFLDLHHRDLPLLVPNPWDVGSAKLMAAIGFRALATTSSGFAATTGRADGDISLDEALSHAAAIAAATPLPVTADLENGFAEDPAGVADTVTRAAAAGCAGCSIEDFTRDGSAPIYPVQVAVERVAAAAAAARSADGDFVLTARCENFLHDRSDLTETVDRLQRYREAGADVLYAPGLRSASDIATVVAEVGAPVNVLLLAGTPSVAELADLGVARISVGGSMAYLAYGAMVRSATALLEDGDSAFLDEVPAGREAARHAFG